VVFIRAFGFTPPIYDPIIDQIRLRPLTEVNCFAGIGRSSSKIVILLRTTRDGNVDDDNDNCRPSSQTQRVLGHDVLHNGER
jgi:hypothetical protein